VDFVGPAGFVGLGDFVVVGDFVDVDLVGEGDGSLGEGDPAEDDPGNAEPEVPSAGVGSPEVGVEVEGEGEVEGDSEVEGPEGGAEDDAADAGTRVPATATSSAFFASATALNRSVPSVESGTRTAKRSSCEDSTSPRLHRSRLRLPSGSQPEGRSPQDRGS
jgi:hypothetical protein